MEELNCSSAVQNGSSPASPQQAGSSVLSPQESCVVRTQATGSACGATEDSACGIHQVKKESMAKMDEKQEKREFSTARTINSLAAIANSYADSDQDDGVSDMEEEQGEVLENNNKNVSCVQLLHGQSSAFHEEDSTCPTVIKLDVSPGVEVIPETKLSTDTDLITSEDKESSNDTTTRKLKNNNTEHLLNDAVYIMSIVGEEPKSLDSCVDVGQGQSAGVCNQAMTDSSTAISPHGNSDNESSSSVDSSADPLHFRQRVTELADLDEERTIGSPPKTKDELFLKDLPDEPELEIEVDEDVHLVPIGKVESIVEVLVVVRALPHTPALDSGSYLFLESREYLGMVFEIFGPVQNPYYSIRFNSDKSLENKNVCSGMKVCFAPDVTDFSIFVFTAQLGKMKGSDASWKHDQEPPAELIEYSDDEEEKQVKAKKKQERKVSKAKETEDTGAAPKPKQHKVGRWSWRNQQQAAPAPEASAMLQSQGGNQSRSVYTGCAAGEPPPAHMSPFIRQMPPFDMTALPGYPRGPPPAGTIRQPQGPLLCSPIMPPQAGHPFECAAHFMGNPWYVNGPPFGGPGLGPIFGYGPPGSPPRMVPYQHEPSGMAPYQHRLFHSGHVSEPPHRPPNDSGPT